MAARDGCQENTGWGSGPGSISILENAGVRVRVRVRVDANPKTALFLKKKIDPNSGPAPTPHFTDTCQRHI